MSFGSGVVALLVDGRGAASEVIRQYGSLPAQASSGNVWPYANMQRAIDSLQKSSVLSAVMTGADGKFGFPEPVPKGEYIVCVGIPVQHDPGVGKPVPRSWPDQLVSTMQIKVLDHEITIPARNAWMLKVSIVSSDRLDLALVHPDHVIWPKVRPTDEQIMDIRNRISQIDPVRRKAETTEKGFRDADTKARDTGQPEEVRKARTKESEFKQETEKLTKANKELEAALAQILSTDTAAGPNSK